MSFVAPSERLFLPESIQHADLCVDEVVLDGAVASHLIKVLRIRTGEQLWLGDGQGKGRKATVTAISKRDLALQFMGDVVVAAPSNPRVILALAMLQNREDLERALVSAVEAGVDKVYLFRSSRSNRPIPDLKSPQGQRLGKVLREASGQARRPWVPELESLDSLSDILNLNAQIFLADPSAQEPDSEATGVQSGDMIALIGPEGGFTEEELKEISTSARGLWLGPAVLRARTAAPLAVHRLVLIRGRKTP